MYVDLSAPLNRYHPRHLEAWPVSESLTVRQGRVRVNPVGGTYSIRCRIMFRLTRTVLLRAEFWLDTSEDLGPKLPSLDPRYCIFYSSLT